MKQILFGLLVLLTVSGCANRQTGLDPQGAVVTNLAELPPPLPEDSYQNSPVYTVGPFDELSIRVFGVEEINGDYRVDAIGRVSVPLAGTVDAAGLTPDELAAKLSVGLRQYIREPNVTVNIKEPNSRTITVEGQVREPGVFRATGQLSLMRAVALAKGTTPDADVEEVVVFRTVGDQQMAALYNLGAIRRGTYSDPSLYPNDIVVVGDSPSTRLIREIAPVIASPLILLLQALL